MSVAGRAFQYRVITETKHEPLHLRAFILSQEQRVLSTCYGGPCVSFNTSRVDFTGCVLLALVLKSSENLHTSGPQ